MKRFLDTISVVALSSVTFVHSLCEISEYSLFPRISCMSRDRDVGIENFVASGRCDNRVRTWRLNNDIDVLLACVSN